QVIGHDLGEGRLVPLPVRARARDRRDLARPFHLDAATLPPERARLDVRAEPDAHDLATGAPGRLLAAQAVVVGGGEGALQDKRVVAGVVDLAGGRLEWEAVGGDEVAPADLRGVESQRARRRVHEALDDEAGLRAPRPAIGGYGGGGGEGARHRDVAGGAGAAGGGRRRGRARRARG